MDPAGLDVRAAGLHEYDVTLDTDEGPRGLRVVVDGGDLDVLGATEAQEAAAVRAALEHVVVTGGGGGLGDRAGLGDLARQAPGLVEAVRTRLG